MGAFWITLTFWVGSTHSCVVTEHERVAPEGSDVHLLCNFSSCPWLQSHSATLEWEFNQTSVPTFHYANRSVITWPNVKFVGKIVTGDFSIILGSVTYEHSGTYLCRFRPPSSPVTYKNYTELTVIHRRSGGRAIHEIFQNGSQDHTVTKRAPEDPFNIMALPSWMLPMCYIVGLLLVVAAGGVLAWCFRWRRAPSKNSAQRNDERVTVHRGEPQSPVRNQDTYVTLQRCKNLPPPSPQREGIYVTMRTPGAMDATVQSSHSRKAIPLEWYAQTDIPLP